MSEMYLGVRARLDERLGADGEVVGGHAVERPVPVGIDRLSVRVLGRGMCVGAWV